MIPIHPRGACPDDSWAAKIAAHLALHLAEAGAARVGDDAFLEDLARDHHGQIVLLLNGE